MGCCSSQNSKPDFEITSIENKLEIKSVSAKKLDKLIYRFSSQGKISSAQLAALYKELNFSKDSSSCAYFKMFYNPSEDAYNARELSSVGVLHSQGTYEEKIAVLFQNYDTDLSKSLSSEEIKQMIADLTSIALLYSSQFAISNHIARNLNESKLIEYRKELVCIRPILMHFYNSNVMEDHPESITLKELQECFLKKNFISLIIPYEMRELGKKFALMLSKTVDIVQNLIENPKSLDPSLIKRAKCASYERKNNRRNTSLSNL